MGPETLPSNPPQLTTLYWKAVSSVCRRPGREEQRCDLTIRILLGADRIGSSTRVWLTLLLAHLHILIALHGSTLDTHAVPAQLVGGNQCTFSAHQPSAKATTSRQMTQVPLLCMYRR